jgi:hypothetical protein
MLSSWDLWAVPVSPELYCLDGKTRRLQIPCDTRLKNMKLVNKDDDKFLWGLKKIIHLCLKALGLLMTIRDLLPNRASSSPWEIS